MKNNGKSHEIEEINSSSMRNFTKNFLIYQNNRDPKSKLKKETVLNLKMNTSF